MSASRILHHLHRLKTTDIHKSPILRLIWIALCLCFASGCATAQGRFGDQLRYSPAFRGYVMAHHNGSDDPDMDDAILILRDPLTGAKLRCEKQAAKWRRVFQEVAADQVSDDNASIVAGVVGGLAGAPSIAVQAAATIIGPTNTVQAMAIPMNIGTLLGQGIVGGAIYDAMRTEDAGELLAHGIAQYKHRHFRQAAAFLELALAKDSSVGVWERAYFFLGMTYAKLERKERARIALSLFVTRAGVRDVNAYREAESLLRELGEEPAPCQSAESVKIYW